jgi:hypothetical protein
MKKRVRRTVLIETEQVSILLDRSNFELTYCAKCGPGFAMLLPEQISRLTDISVREVYRLVESSELHYVDCGKVFVCLESLLVLHKENGGE